MRSHIGPDTGQCVNEETEPQRGVDIRQYARKDVGLRREVDCEIPHQLERRTKHSLQGYGNLSLADTF